MKENKKSEEILDWLDENILCRGIYLIKESLFILIALVLTIIEIIFLEKSGPELMNYPTEAFLTLALINSMIIIIESIRNKNTLKKIERKINKEDYARITLEDKVYETYNRQDAINVLLKEYFESDNEIFKNKYRNLLIQLLDNEIFCDEKVERKKVHNYNRELNKVMKFLYKENNTLN